MHSEVEAVADNPKSFQGNEMEKSGTGHPTPLTYLKVASILAAVTAVEVALLYIDALSAFLFPIFMILSAFKFALVVMFYMHLKFDHRLLSWFFVGCLFLAGFVMLALLGLFGALN
jgi:cytochrome c oxidase subunit 4